MPFGLANVKCATASAVTARAVIDFAGVDKVTAAL